MIPALQALLLGVVQGLTEFIPVSSSGHLVLIPKLFGWSELGIAFDVAIHLGTLVALIIYFRKEWKAVIKGFFSSLRVKPADWDFEMRLAWMLILATIPAAVAGALLGDIIEKHLRTPAWVAITLVLGSLVMIAAEYFGSESRSFARLRVSDAAVVGTAQILALGPGVSRSGITISTGMLAGLDREAAARFAFMMSAPIIAGSGVYEAYKLARHGLPANSAGAFVTGFAASALTGLVAVRFMMRYLRRGTLKPFIIYRIALAALVFIIIAVK